jgi:uncharacterized small protein (DUF1192 family)
MTHIPYDQLKGFDLLTPLAVDRLHKRIAAANNEIAVVADEVRAELAALDTRNAANTDALRAKHAERAFLLAQQTYLALLSQVVVTQD